ncbi:MAG: hypothetical protein KKG33_13170 [candidate division Zixibacteria bacterium]|nr:hypothetical protein [candidate division Zixibacteria bacterium]MBU1470108.1 hypothetical protein [candidate division Zixibacteria bacterium]MBU2626504.1 hypothetical protein [candidate division Zixibacteria bacterium]
MSTSNNKRYLTPYIIGASDLAFILLFFFIIVGSGAQRVERIDMPYKQANAVDKTTQSPFRVEIYEKDVTSDSCRMAFIFERSMPPETLFVTIDNQSLAEVGGYQQITGQLGEFVQTREAVADSIRIDIFSSAYSYYGLIAITIAACNQLDYPCNLVYRTDAG